MCDHGSRNKKWGNWSPAQKKYFYSVQAEEEVRRTNVRFSAESKCWREGRWLWYKPASEVASLIPESLITYKLKDSVVPHGVLGILMISRADLGCSAVHQCCVSNSQVKLAWHIEKSQQLSLLGCSLLHFSSGWPLFVPTHRNLSCALSHLFALANKTFSSECHHVQQDQWMHQRVVVDRSTCVGHHIWSQEWEEHKKWILWRFSGHLCTRGW